MKKIITISLIFLLTFFFTGCTMEVNDAEIREIKKSPTYYFDILGENEMPIGGYIGPTASFGHDGNYCETQITDFHYKQMSEAGLNFTMGMKEDFNINRQNIIDSLVHAGNNGVMYFVKDSYLFDLYNGKSPISKEDFEQRIEAYNNYNAFAGLVGRDEPFGNDLALCKEVQDVFKEVFSAEESTALYFNSLSYQCPKVWLGGGTDGSISDWTLEKYLDEYFKNINGMKFYSYDLYPFVGKEDSIKPDYFKNLVLVREYASKYNVPFFTFIQAGGNLDNDSNWRTPTEGEMLWQINTSIAFGAKGYQFFTYNTPPEFPFSTLENMGLVNRYGKKTPMYYYAQKANNQIKACDDKLMQSALEGVIVTDKSPASIPENIILNNYYELQGVSGDANIVGCFNYLGKTALYVVNNSLTKDKAKISLNFDSNYSYEVIQRATSRNISGKNITLTLAPGEGAMVILK
ncbi:MAG: hypothetical protein WCR27_07480 [Eubacteriales bacterium]